MSDRNFPVPRPDSGSETGFTLGLGWDIGKRLEAAGYPALTGADLVELMQALFGFLYGKATSEPPAAPAPGTCDAPPADHFDLGPEYSDGYPLPGEKEL